MDGTVLVADDDRTIRTVLTQALTRAGCKVHATSSLTTLMRWVGEGRGDAVISDVVMPDGNGLEMLPKISQDRPDLPVIVISAQNTIMTAIKANEANAFDYLPKPFDLPDLMKRTARALDQAHKAPEREAIDVSDVAGGGDSEELPLIGRSPVMQAIYRSVAQVVNLNIPLLFSGPSGTGKTLLAQAIHDLSDRRALPFVQVMESDLNELDGPARLLSQAKGGTLVFDLIEGFDNEAQTRIIRMMDTPGDNPPRFVATTQVSGGEGGILPALYHRLSGAVLQLPPLSERLDDVPLLAEHFLSKAIEDGLPERSLSDAALKELRAHAWPGNVRQLENALRAIALSAQSEDITEQDAKAALGQAGSAAVPGPALENEKLSESVARHLNHYFEMHGDMLPPEGLYARILREIELPLIEIALDATGGNQAKCADLLGINRNTLRKKITDLEIQVTRRRKLM